MTAKEIEAVREALRKLYLMLPQQRHVLANYYAVFDAIGFLEEENTHLLTLVEGLRGKVEQVESDIDFVIDVCAHEISYSEQTGPRAEDIKKALKDYLVAHPFNKEFALYIEEQKQALADLPKGDEHG